MGKVHRIPYEISSPQLLSISPFCAFARSHAYCKCSILQYLLPFKVVWQRRITPPQRLLLGCCPSFYCGWGAESTRRLQGSRVASPLLGPAWKWEIEYLQRPLSH